MKNTVLWALIALNAVLLAGLVLPLVQRNQAVAQPANANQATLIEWWLDEVRNAALTSLPTA